MEDNTNYAQVEDGFEDHLLRPSPQLSLPSDEPLPLSVDLKRLWDIGWPSTLSYALDFMVYLVTLAVVGNLDGGSRLAGCGIALSWLECTFAIPAGSAAVIEMLGSRAHGAGSHRRLSRVLYQGLLVATILGCAGTLLQTFPDTFLKLFGSHGESTRAAARFLRIVGPSTIPLAWASCLRAFLLTQNITRPVVVANFLLLVIHILLTLGLTTGMLQIHALGVDGAAIALAASHCLSPFLLAAVVFVPSPCRARLPVMFAPNSRTFDRPELREFASECSVAAAMGVAEAFGMEIPTILAGHVSTQALAAQSILTNIYIGAWFGFLGVDVAVQVVIGNDLGANAPKRARATATRALAGSLIGATCVATLCTVFRKQLVDVFTGSPEVSDIASSVLPTSAAALVCDVLLAVLAGGVLVGLGRLTASAVAIFVAFYVLILPFGYLFGVHLGFGLNGIWGAVLGAGLITGGGLLVYTFSWVDWAAEAAKAALGGEDETLQGVASAEPRKSP